MLSHEASLAMAQMDTDRNGEVDFQELLSYAQVFCMLVDGPLHTVQESAVWQTRRGLFDPLVLSEDRRRQGKRATKELEVPVALR